MPESLYGILPWIAAAGFIAAGPLIVSRPRASRSAWRIPAAACLVFAAWTGWAAASEGALAFWPEHLRGAWGNQIWFDLLLAASIALALLAPRARAVGMSPLPWFLLVACTGSVGLLAMLARCLFLEGRQGSDAPAPNP